MARVTLEFVVDDKGSVAVRRAKGEVAGLGDQMDRTQRRGREFGGGLDHVGTRAVALQRHLVGLAATVGVGLGFREAIRQSAAFESSLARLQIESGETEETIAGIGRQIRRMGVESGEGMDQTAAALRILRRETGDTEEALARLPLVLNLADAAEQDAASSARALGAVLRGLEGQIEGPTEAGDLLAFVAAKLGGEAIPAFSDAIQGMGQPLQRLGIGLRDVVPLMIEMQRIGAEPRQLRTLIGVLANDSEKLQAVLGGSADFSDIFATIQRLAQAPAEALTPILGPGANQVFANLAARLPVLREMQREFDGIGGSVERAAAIIDRTSAEKFDILKASVRDLLVQFAGDSGLVDALGNFSEHLREVDDTGQTVARTIGEDIAGAVDKLTNNLTLLAGALALSAGAFIGGRAGGRLGAGLGEGVAAAGPAALAAGAVTAQQVERFAASRAAMVAQAAAVRESAQAAGAFVTEWGVVNTTVTQSTAAQLAAAPAIRQSSAALVAMTAESRSLSQIIGANAGRAGGVLGLGIVGLAAATGDWSNAIKDLIALQLGGQLAAMNPILGATALAIYGVYRAGEALGVNWGELIEDGKDLATEMLHVNDAANAGADIMREYNERMADLIMNNQRLKVTEDQAKIIQQRLAGRSEPRWLMLITDEFFTGDKLAGAANAVKPPLEQGANESDRLAAGLADAASNAEKLKDEARAALDIIRASADAQMEILQARNRSAENAQRLQEQLGTVSPFGAAEGDFSRRQAELEATRQTIAAEMLKTTEAADQVRLAGQLKATEIELGGLAKERALTMQVITQQFADAAREAELQRSSQSDQLAAGGELRRVQLLAQMGRLNPVEAITQEFQIQQQLRDSEAERLETEIQRLMVEDKSHAGFERRLQMENQLAGIQQQSTLAAGEADLQVQAVRQQAMENLLGQSQQLAGNIAQIVGLFDQDLGAALQRALGIFNLLVSTAQSFAAVMRTIQTIQAAGSIAGIFGGAAGAGAGSSVSLAAGSFVQASGRGGFGGASVKPVVNLTSPQPMVTVYVDGKRSALEAMQSREGRDIMIKTNREDRSRGERN